MTDVDVPKESKPSFYLKHILPLLIQNRVVHFQGFGNRLAFDPIPFELQVISFYHLLSLLCVDRIMSFIFLTFLFIGDLFQRLRCRCNFHALQFVPKIQETGTLLLQRLRRHTQPGLLDQYLVGSHTDSIVKEKKAPSAKASRYLALHLRFEIDMVAHSLCEFGGGEEERREMEAYRQMHFPALTVLQKTTKYVSSLDYYVIVGILFFFPLMATAC